MLSDWIDVRPGVVSIYVGDRIKDAVLKSQAERCEAEGHDYENCCSVTLQIYRKCRWCGDTVR